MWEGEITKELEELYALYNSKFGGAPDEYDVLCYEAMSYEEIVGYIREALKKGVELPDVVP